KVGVIGTGTMGEGVARTCIQYGYDTLLRSRSRERLDQVLRSIRGSLERAVARGRMKEAEKEAALGHLKGVTALEDLAPCDLISENVIEDLEEKKRLFAALDKICPPPTILSTDTSCLPVIALAQATKKPGRVVGLHFFTPPPYMKFIEVIGTILSSPETVETTRAFAVSLGKEVIMARDTPGFVVNRILIPFFLEAIRVLESGIATAEEIDKGFELGLGYPFGPLSQADSAGLDTIYLVADNMYEQLKDPRFAPPPLLQRMVLAGHLGRKTGKGFHEYREGVRSFGGPGGA
ncbi:MAG: 3-hydroxyacyl-CoA dehydrogenase NAD-binding domain-containing protein, partial [Chloroflexota bacterium]|nr:3-hydroxyacyl-CoA dehydrogenase NAD-binding domain-containing protein [Chloroflexota bacterium]